MSVQSFGSFGNPIVGGKVGTLIRDSIQSRNYVAGSTGWIIRSDGTAEFNGVVIRGSGVFGNPTGERVQITAAGEIKIYNAANQLIVSLDAHGLLVRDPTTGTFIQTTLTSGFTLLALQPPNVAGHVFGPALVYGDSDVGLADAWMKLESPVIDGGATGSISVYGANAGVPDGSLIRLDADRIVLGGNGLGVGWGPVARAYFTTDSAAITAETVVLTASQAVYQKGRAYKATYGNLVSSSNVNARVGIRLRKTNLAGQQIGYSGILPNSTVANNFCQGAGSFYFKNSTAADIIAFIALTLENLDGGANVSAQKTNTSQPRFLVIEDCGDTTAYDFATDLV